MNLSAALSATTSRPAIFTAASLPPWMNKYTACSEHPARRATSRTLRRISSAGKGGIVKDDDMAHNLVFGYVFGRQDCLMETRKPAADHKGLIEKCRLQRGLAGLVRNSNGRWS
jgi:hypothetical protein